MTNLEDYPPRICFARSLIWEAFGIYQNDNLKNPLARTWAPTGRCSASVMSSQDDWETDKQQRILNMLMGGGTCGRKITPIGWCLKVKRLIKLDFPHMCRPGLGVIYSACLLLEMMVGNWWTNGWTEQGSLRLTNIPTLRSVYDPIPKVQSGEEMNL